MNRKQILGFVALATVACAFVCLADRVVVTYSGPSGQGDVIWKQKSTGTELMRIAPASGVSISVSSNITADAIAASNVTAGALADTVIAQSYSNAAGYVYCSNLTVKAGGSVTVPASSISEASVSLVGLTTNVQVMGPGSATNTFVYTNGLLKAIQ